MIKLSDVSKLYNKVKVLDNVSFEIEKGEFAILLGPSGSGKTTILRLIAGFDYPDDGEIIINERIVSTKKYILAPYKRNIGMIFQDLALWPHMSIEKHLEFALSNQKLKKGEKNKKIEGILELLQLDNYRRRFPHELSGGEKQRLAIARAIIIQPQLLLFDEPLANIDPILKDKIQNLLISLHEKLKTTFLYVTHDIGEAFNLGEKIIILNKGKIEETGIPSHIYYNPSSQFTKEFIKTALPRFNKPLS
jgi:iron(III) transport system ATP-binding protein